MFAANTLTRAAMKLSSDKGNVPSVEMAAYSLYPIVTELSSGRSPDLQQCTSDNLKT